MGRWVATLVVATVALGAGAASAQERTTGAQRWEVAGFPGGGIVFTEGSNDKGGPDFGTYALGGSLTYNWNRYWGIEGEIGGAFGVDQRIGFRTGSVGNVSPPNMLAYNANAVFYPLKSDRRFVPYVTGGIGGLTMFEKQNVGFSNDETFFTRNAGAGVKWYLGRWGVRGDYRFFAVESNNDAPEFFGRDTRYGHRVYGGIILGLGR